MNQLWFGTEASLVDLVQQEKWAGENAIALMDRRKAFLDEDSGGEEAIGDYLIADQGNGVASIKVHGSLTNGYKWWHQYAVGMVTSYEAVADALVTLAQDDTVSKITLDISSGGGGVMGIDALGDKIRRVNNIKPVIAVTQTAAFSAAYWIASSAKEVVASRMAEVGSIGTLLVHQSIARMAEEAGVDFTVIRAGKYKAIGLPMETLSEDDKAYLQADVEKANSFFLEHVSLRRNLTMSSKGIWAEGKTFFAEEAQGVGLVDRIGSMEDLVSASGAALTHRSKPMLISEEKRAQIAAGANPEDVLTAEELTAYQAELDTAAEAATSDKAAEAETDAEEGTTIEASVEPTETDDYRQMLKDNGKLEAKLEVAQERITQMEASAASQQAQMNSLTEIGKLAVNNLQVALGKGKESFDSPEGLVQAYNSLQAEMSERFKTGRQSQEPKDDNKVSHLPLAFRNIQK